MRHFKSVLASGLLLASAVVAGEVGKVTWLHPQTNGLLEVESSVSGVAIHIRNDAGQEITNAASLAAAGWHYANDGVWESPNRSGGDKLHITVTGLPKGTHEVYVRYFSQPPVPGNSWWFALQAEMEGQKACWLDETAGKIARGTGGYDPTTLYEASIGRVGRDEDPVGQVSFSINRYIWSETARFGAVRIESAPSMLAFSPNVSPDERDRIVRTLTAQGPRNADGTAAYGVAVVSGTLKVRPTSFSALAKQPLLPNVDMAAARGEYENRQVILYSPDKALTDVSFDCTPLVGKNGSTISTSEILVAPMGYCPYNLPWNEAVNGYWPDPILTFLKKLRIRRGDVQSLWLRIHVSRDTKPGVYTGSVAIRPANASACTIPVTLRVWDFDLPKRPRLRTVWGCNPNNEFEMSYGLNPSSIYGFKEESLAKFPAWAKAGVTAISLGYINLGIIDKTTKLPTEAQLDKWVSDIRPRYEAAKKAGLGDACYVYMFDEADKSWDGALQMVSKRLRAEFPDLLLLTTAQRSSAQRRTFKALNGWVPLTSHYKRAAAAADREHGKQIWWYTCNVPRKPFANLLMTQPAMDLRLLMGFMAYAYQTDGFLYYATSLGYQRKPAITTGPYTKWPIKNNAHDHIYQKGPDGPLPSLRLETLRDGLEDYDYLAMANDLISDAEAAGNDSPEVKALANALKPYMAPGSDLVTGLTRYSEDVTLLETVRRRLGNAIEAAQHSTAETK